MYAKTTANRAAPLIEHNTIRQPSRASISGGRPSLVCIRCVKHNFNPKGTHNINSRTWKWGIFVYIWKRGTLENPSLSLQSEFACTYMNLGCPNFTAIPEYPKATRLQLPVLNRYGYLEYSSAHQSAPSGRQRVHATNVQDIKPQYSQLSARCWKLHCFWSQLRLDWASSHPFHSCLLGISR